MSMQMIARHLSSAGILDDQDDAVVITLENYLAKALLMIGWS